MADKDMLAAVTAAVTDAEETNAAAPEPAVKDDATNSDGSSAADAGSGADTSESDSGSEEVETAEEGGEGKDSEPEAAEGAAGAEGEADGTKPKAGAEGTTPKTEEPAAKKPPDPVNDPIPPGVSERTRERITSLVGTVKTQAAQLEQANTLFDSIADTGMQPEELATMLSYAKIKHHGTAEQKQQAYEFLKAEMRALALEVGDADGADVLAGHADLQEAVANNQITEAHAKEMAMLRERTRRASETSAAATATTEAQRAHAAGSQALSQRGAALQTRDGVEVYNHRKAVVMAQIGPKRDAAGNVTDRGLLAEYPPAQWASIFQRCYDAIPKPVPATPAAPAKPQPKPLRPAAPAAGGGNAQRAAGNMFDAIKGAITGSDD